MIRTIRAIDASPLKIPSVRQVEHIVSFVTTQFVRSPDVVERFCTFSSKVALGRLQMSTATPAIYEQYVLKMLARNPTWSRDDLPTFAEAHEGFRDPNGQVQINNGYVSALTTFDPVLLTSIDPGGGPCVTG